jgi:hypothetical protein
MGHRAKARSIFHHAETGTKPHTTVDIVDVGRTILAWLFLLVYTHPLLTASAEKNQCVPGGPKSYCDPDGQKGYQEFRVTIKLFPYSASDVRKERVLKNYA